MLSRAEARKESKAFTPPYDKNFPKEGTAKPSQIVHALQKDVAHRAVCSMAAGKLSPPEIHNMVVELLRDSKDIASLENNLKAIKARLS